MRLLSFCLFSLIIFSCSVSKTPISSETNTYSGIINKRVIWQGKVIVDKDLLVDEKGEVVIVAGTVVNIVKSDISRTEPIFLYPETEILVKGKLVIEGTEENPVIFQSAEIKKELRDWAGIILQKGFIRGDHFVIRDAYNGIAALGGRLEIRNLSIENGYLGFSLLDEAKGDIERVKVSNCQTGLIIDNRFTSLNDVILSKNSEGMIIKKASEKLYNFKIYNNIFGIIISKESLPFLIGENKVYENKSNIFIFDSIPADK